MNKSKRFIRTAAMSIFACSLVSIFSSCQNKSESKSNASFSEGTEVRMIVTFNGAKFATYNEASPWAAPTGKTYNKGDLLPVWTHIEEQLKIKITDATPKSGQKETEIFDAAKATGFNEADIYQADPRRLSNEGINGRIVALNKHFDNLPYFSKFLDENPSVKSQLTQADGNIYAAPYFDDINKLEKMFMMRIDWVKKILDEASPNFDKSRTIKPEYEGVYNYGSGKKINVGPNNLKTIPIAQNIISIQNSLKSKNGAALAQALRDYIDATYMNAVTGYKNRSDLFISPNATYDADEMVALMRAVKTNSKYLTGTDKDMIIFYQRNVGGKKGLMRLGDAWGTPGIGRENDLALFLTKENKIQDTRLTDEYYKTCTYITEIYKEGLVIQDYDQPRGKIEDFRNYSFQQNEGFMTHDYAASTVVQHDLLKKEDLAKYGTVFEPVVPPAAPWFSDQFEHYSESNRSIKPLGGWGIVSSATGDVLAAALALVDYPFSEDGLDVMTFGPKGLYWNEYTTIAGQKVPKLIPQFYEDNIAEAQGNWSDFMRGFVGSTLPVGHVKNTIAIETQISNEHYSNGIERIAASDMTLASLGSTVSPERRLVPAIVPLTEDQIEALSLNTYTAYHNEWDSRIIKFGFGGSMGKDGKTPTIDEYKGELIKRGLQQTVDIYNLAYDTVKE